MKLNVFSKKNLLDEMQEQKLCKVESRGFWMLWWGLLAVLLIQNLGGASARQMAGEWVLFMIACLYGLIECLRNGIWDRHIQPTLGANTIGSLMAGIVIFLLVFAKNKYWPGALCSAIFTFLLCLAATQLTVQLYRKRRERLEHPKEDEDEFTN